MKKFLILFSAALLFAQELDVLPDTVASQEDDTVAQTGNTDSLPLETADTEIHVEGIDTVNFTDTAYAETGGAKIHKIIFMGIQTNEIPELRNTFEDMIRAQFILEPNIDLIPKDISARISRKLFHGKKIVIDSVFFEELEKYELQNTIVLLIDVEEYYIKAVRRFGFGAGIEGKLKANYLFYDAAEKKELFLAKASSSSVIKKGFIFWHSLESKVTVSAQDIKKINADLLNDIVEQGFDMLEIAVSLKKS